MGAAMDRAHIYDYLYKESSKEKAMNSRLRHFTPPTQILAISSRCCQKCRWTTILTEFRCLPGTIS